MVIVLATINY